MPPSTEGTQPLSPDPVTLTHANLTVRWPEQEKTKLDELRRILAAGNVPSSNSLIAGSLKIYSETLRGHADAVVETHKQLARDLSSPITKKTGQQAQLALRALIFQEVKRISPAMKAICKEINASESDEHQYAAELISLANNIQAEKRLEIDAWVRTALRAQPSLWSRVFSNPIVNVVVGGVIVAVISYFMFGSAQDTTQSMDRTSIGEDSSSN